VSGSGKDKGGRRFKPYPGYKDSGIQWLEEIPALWDVRKWRYCCHVTEGQVAPDDERYRDRIMIAPNHIESGTGRILFTETAEQQGAISGKYLVKPGDLIYSKIRPALNKVCVATGDWLCSADMYPVKITASELRARYLLYFMLSEPFVRLMVDESMRVAMPKVNREKLAPCPLLIPTPPEQHAITTFLDSETARIDALVAKKERLIDLLQEKRAALITRAVTKGLDPNVHMKDSGVEWLGEIPAHWECVALARLTISRCDGPFGSSLKSEHYSDTGVRVVRLQNIGWAQFLASDEAYIGEVYAGALGDHGVVAGDLLIAGLGDERHPVGRACTAPEGIEPAMVKADCFRFRLDQNRLLSEFAEYQLSASATAAAGMMATGATRSRMNLTATAARKLALPPLDEQRAIVEVLNRREDEYRTLSGRVRDAIDRLKELRSALISAAVTDKIDVREETRA
jgi:type I restriction enzyme S subunit